MANLWRVRGIRVEIRSNLVPVQAEVARQQLAFPPSFNFFDAMIRKCGIDHFKNRYLVSSALSTTQLDIATMPGLCVRHEACKQALFAFGGAHVLLARSFVDQHIDALNLAEALLPGRIETRNLVDIDAELAEARKRRILMLSE